MIREGAPAPLFSALNQRGEKISLADCREKTVVLYFYPKDGTPGCTKQACAFRDLFPDFGKIKTTVFGISPDTPASHAKFIEKYRLNFDLLSDEDKSIAQAYGFWVEKSMYGKTFWGNERSTVVIGPDGKIKAVFRKVKPETHPEELLRFLSEA